MKFAYIFSEYLIYSKHKVNLNFIYLLQNRLLILICKILKRKRIFLVKKYKDFEDEKINNIIKRYIVIKI